MHHLQGGAVYHHARGTERQWIMLGGHHCTQLCHTSVIDIDVRCLQWYSHHLLAVGTTCLGDGYAILELLLLFVDGLALPEGGKLKALVVVFTDNTLDGARSCLVFCYIFFFFSKLATSYFLRSYVRRLRDASKIYILFYFYYIL